MLCRTVYIVQAVAHKALPYLRAPYNKYLKEKLIKLDLQLVKDISCLFTNKRLIVFFYINNIIVLVHSNYFSNY
jgi:hypothetical protein